MNIDAQDAQDAQDKQDETMRKARNLSVVNYYI